jgi:hypothetical protein
MNKIVREIKRIVSQLSPKRIALQFLPKIKGVSIFDRNVVEIRSIYEADTFEMPLLKDVFGDTHILFKPYSCQIPATYVAIITNGICEIGREEVFASPNECFIEITSQKQNPFIGEPALRNIKKIKGVVANLSLSGLENNYYHFCIEWLTRVHLLKKSMLDIDYYIVPQKKSFQKQYLDILQIDKRKILTLEEGCNIEAEYLVVPSIIINWEPINYRGYGSFLKQWLPKWLSEVYKNLEIIADDNVYPNNNKVYISRRLASWRKVENEVGIINILKKLGFSIYCMELMTVEQQINLFRNAKLIFTSHGAGLVNMCHCKSTAVIFEIYPEYYHDSSFRIQALALGHKYEYLIGKTSNINNVPSYYEDVYIDPIEFENAIQTIVKKHNFD